MLGRQYKLIPFSDPLLKAGEIETPSSKKKLTRKPRGMAGNRQVYIFHQGSMTITRRPKTNSSRRRHEPPLSARKVRYSRPGGVRKYFPAAVHQLKEILSQSLILAERIIWVCLRVDPPKLLAFLWFPLQPKKGHLQKQRSHIRSILLQINSDFFQVHECVLRKGPVP